MSADPSPNSEFGSRLEIERILDAFERELQAGRRPERQAFLPDDPQLRRQVDAELQRIENEYRARESHPGEASTIAGSPAPIAILRGPGGSLGPYELLELLGKGGMGTVFKARHTRLGKFVAVKVLPPHLVRSVEALARFEREMKAVGALEHPNIVRATDADEHLGTHYLVMEYIDGRDLQQLVKEDGPLPIGEACRLVRDAALALDHAHRNGLIHRDIKPSNLLRTKSGQLKVLDLGLARLAAEGVPQEGLTDTGVSLGTPDYMAPEQWNDSHAADARTDLYALGCTLFYLLVSRAPYATEQYRTLIGKMAAHAEAPIPNLRGSRPEVPAELERLIQKLLAKKPSDRVQTAEELAESLGPWVTADIAPKPNRQFAPARSRVPYIIAAILAFAILAILTSALLHQSRKTLPPNAAKPTQREVVPEAPKPPPPPNPVPEETQPATARELALTCLTPDGRLELLPFVDPVRDRWTFGTLRNDWRKDDQGLWNVADEKTGRISMPVDLPQSGYDLEVEFTITKSGTLHLDLVGQESVMIVYLTPPRERLNEGPRINPALNRRTKVRLQRRIEPERDWLEAVVDGETVFDGKLTASPRKSDYHPEPNRMAFVTGAGAEVMIHHVRVRPLPGEEGEVIIRNAPPIVGELPSYVRLDLEGDLIPAPVHQAGKPWKQLFRREPIQAADAAWSSDGAWLAVSDNSGAIRMYDAELLELRRVLRGPQTSIDELAWQPGGTKLLSLQRYGTTCLWNIERGEWAVLDKGRSNRVAWSQNGEQFAIGYHWTDIRLTIWNANGILQRTAPVEFTSELAWSRDGKTIFVSRGDKLFKVDVASGQVSPLIGPALTGSLTASETDDILAIGRGNAADENYIEIWNYSELRRVGALKTGHRVLMPKSLSFDPNGGLLAMATQSAHAEILHWKDSGRVRDVYTGTPGDYARWHPSGDRIVVTSFRPIATVISTDSQQPVREVGEFNFDGVSLSPNQRDLILLSKRDGQVKLLVHSSDGKEIFKGRALKTGFGWTPSGKHFLLWTLEGFGRLLDAKSGNVVTRFDSLAAKIESIAWTADESLLAAADAAQDIHLWNRDGTLRGTLKTDGRRADQLQFSPDGKELAVSYSATKQLQIWNLETMSAAEPIAVAAAASQILWLDKDSLLVRMGGELSGWRRGVDSLEKLAQTADHLIPRANEPGNPWLADNQDRVKSLDGKFDLMPQHRRGYGQRTPGLSVVDNGEVSLFNDDHVIRTWNSETGKLVRQLVLLANDQTITLDPAGNVLAKTEHADREVIWADSRPDGTFDVKVEAP